MSSRATTVLAAELRNVDKAFYGVKANDNVNFELARGEVHALLGENGAGKSTLCSILAGLYRPDAGEMRLEGDLVSFKSPRDALSAGIGMVYQHFRLVSNLTVAENLALGHPDIGLRLDQKELHQSAEELGDKYGLPVDPAARVWQLSVGEQQRVEILKLLYRDARILILDEPTAVLTPQEAKSWGKIKDANINNVVVYSCASITFPILCQYVLAGNEGRKHRRLYSRLDKLVSELSEAAKSNPELLKDVEQIRKHTS